MIDIFSFINTYTVPQNNDISILLYLKMGIFDAHFCVVGGWNLIADIYTKASKAIQLIICAYLFIKVIIKMVNNCRRTIGKHEKFRLCIVLCTLSINWKISSADTYVCMNNFLPPICSHFICHMLFNVCFCVIFVFLS